MSSVACKIAISCKAEVYHYLYLEINIIEGDFFMGAKLTKIRP